MFRKATLMFVLLCLPSLANAQLSIDGPKTGTMGYRSKAKLQIDVNDPKLTCAPANDDWMAVQDFTGQKYIDFVPGKALLMGPDGKFQSRLFTFTVAGNKENKTYLQTWEILITPDSDVVPTPVPTPVPVPVPTPNSDLDNAIQSSYLVSPDATALSRLTDVYIDFKAQVDANKFANNKDAHTYLQSKSAPIGTALQGVRNTVTLHFAAAAPRETQWDQAKLSAAIGRVIVSLNKLKR